MGVKPYLLFILLVGWGVFLLLQNYILTPTVFDNLFTWIGRFFLLLLLTLLSIGLGEFILDRLKIKKEDSSVIEFLERKTLGAGLGLSLLAYIVFFLGIFKLYYSFTGFILIAILLLLFLPKIKDILQKKEISIQSRLIPLSICLGLIIVLMGVCIPPLDYDTLEYHLGVPAQYIKAHGIIYLPYNVYSNFPLHLEMLYTLGILLDGPILSKMIHFLFLILTLLIIFLLGNKFSTGLTMPRQAVGVALLIFLNIPIVAITSAKAYNDLGLSFFGLASIYSLWIWSEKRDKKFLILAALFCGSSLATKYTAIIFFLLPLAFFIIIASLKEKRKVQYATSKVIHFIIISILIASPWLVKNLVYTGNPVFPLGYRQLGGRNWGEFEATRFKEHHQIDLTDFKKVIDKPKKIITGEEEGIGITLLLFLPFLFFIRRPPPAIKLFGLYSIFYFLFWTFFTHRMPRFLIPALAILSILASFSIFYFLNLRKSLGYIMISFLSIAIIFNYTWLLYQFSLFHPLPFVSGKDSQNEYLKKIFYLYPAIDFINTSLPKDSKILFIAEARTFYCEKDFIANTPLDKNIIVEISDRSKGPEDILDSLRKMEVTHILYNVSEARRITQSYQSFNWANPKSQDNYLGFMERYLKILFSQEGVVVAEILYE